MVVQSYFAIISREWCFPCDMNVISSARARQSRKIENIWETRVILFGKNITERVDHGDIGASTISSRPTFGRIAATNPIREFRSEWRLHYSGVIGFLAADVIVAVISVSYSLRICIWFKTCTYTCVYLFYIAMHLFLFNKIFIMNLWRYLWLRIKSYIFVNSLNC